MNLEPIKIETNRLILKGFSPQDMTIIFEKYSNVEIKKILGHRTEEEFQIEEFKQKNGYAAYNRSFVLFLLIEKITNNIIGRCGLHNWNLEHKRAEIGYNMADDNSKRKGLMTEAVSAVIDFGFIELKLHRIEAIVGNGNIPSLRIMAKYNFTKEGVMREHFFVGENYEDSFIFSKLQNEYFKEKDNSTTNF